MFSCDRKQVRGEGFPVYANRQRCPTRSNYDPCVIWIVIAVAVVLILVAISSVLRRKADTIIDRQAALLSRTTGMPAADIAAEMKAARMTPDEWTRAHGINPQTVNPYGNQSPRWRAYTRTSEGALNPLADATIANGEVRLQLLHETLPLGHPGRLMQRMIEEEAMFQLAEAQGAQPSRQEGMGALDHPIVWEPPLHS